MRRALLLAALAETAAGDDGGFDTSLAAHLRRQPQDVDALATALLDLGLVRGDRVGLVAENRYEWLLIDMSLASLGVVDVPEPQLERA